MGGVEGREPRISLDDVRDKNIMQLKKLNIALFPIRYNDKYYADALASGKFSKLARRRMGMMAVKDERRRASEILYIREIGEKEPVRVSSAIKYGIQPYLAYYSDICVGAIACRLEKESGALLLYIMTLGVLAPYRGLGIGTKLLDHVLDVSAKQNVTEIYLHVQTNNDDAIAFYKKFGFEVTETIQNYYAYISPPDCFVLRKNIQQAQSKK